MNLSTLTNTELRALDTQVRTEVIEREARAIREARDEIIQIAKRVGVPLKELVDSLLKRDIRKVAAKYRNPGNSAQVWTGRGRTPTWAQALIDQGRLEEARIR